MAPLEGSTSSILSRYLALKRSKDRDLPQFYTISVDSSTVTEICHSTPDEDYSTCLPCPDLSMSNPAYSIQSSEEMEDLLPGNNYDYPSFSLENQRTGNISPKAPLTLDRIIMSAPIDDAPSLNESLFFSSESKSFFPYSSLRDYDENIVISFEDPPPEEEEQKETTSLFEINCCVTKIDPDYRRLELIEDSIGNNLYRICHIAHKIQSGAPPSTFFLS